MPPCVPLDQAVVFVRAITVVVGAEGREDSESCIATQHDRDDSVCQRCRVDSEFRLQMHTATMKTYLGRSV